MVPPQRLPLPPPRPQSPRPATRIAGDVAPKNGSPLARTRDLFRNRRPASGAAQRAADADAAALVMAPVELDSEGQRRVVPVDVTGEVSNVSTLLPPITTMPDEPVLDEPTVVSPLVPMRPTGLAPEVEPEVRAVPLILPHPLVLDDDVAAGVYPLSDPLEAPATRGRNVVQYGPGGRRRRPRIRRVTRVIRHVDPWSVFKVALGFSFVLYGICLTAGVLLWNVAYTTGTIDNVERFFESFGWDTFEFKGGELFHNAWIGGLFVAVGLTGLAVLGATLFNLMTDLVGGVRVTVLEEEVVERHPAVARPLLRRKTGEIRIASEQNDPGDLSDDLVDEPLGEPPRTRESVLITAWPWPRGSGSQLRMTLGAR